MINRIEFFKSGDMLTGFECKGHTGFADDGNDVLCAFISSACYLTANTITDVIKLDARASASDGYMSLHIKSSPEKAQDILNGLVLHMTELQKDYPQNIKVTISEV
ncbi:ribosomal-processing cysteine protease Prp [Eubacterium sp.]